MLFSELSLSDEVFQGIKDAGFTQCTDVQAQTFIHTLQGRDVCVQSQTGTGKTAAYLVSVFQLMTHREELKGTMTVIIAPTRELAVQIEQEAKLLGAHVDLRIGCFYGGVGYVAQEKLLAEGVDVVIGTPGRLIDFSQSRKLDFSRVGIVVIDEADRLFDMGFYPDIRKILRKMPPREKRISMLFSATLGVRVRNIAWEHMNNPADIEINPEQVTVEGISQALYHVSKREKFSLLLGLLKRDKPETAIIFANTKRATELVSRRLEMNGFKSTFIMGDLPQRKRLRIIEGVKNRTAGLLVATDVAARGLHIEDLDMVINYDLPEDRENYVHRIGRTARAGKTGKAVSLADEQYVFNLEAIESFIGMKIPVIPITDDLIAEDASEGVRIPLGRYGEAEAARVGSHGSRGRTPNDRTPRRQGDRRARREPPRPAGHHAPPRVVRAGEAPGTTVKQHGSHLHHHDHVRTGRPDTRATLDERLEYYRRKYGEEFVRPKVETQQSAPLRESTEEEKATRSIWARVVGLLRRDR